MKAIGGRRRRSRPKRRWLDNVSGDIRGKGLSGGRGSVRPSRMTGGGAHRHTSTSHKNGTKGCATRNDFVTMRALDTIFATLNKIQRYRYVWHSLKMNIDK